MRFWIPFFTLCAVCLMLGCGTSGITVYKMVDGNPVPTVEVTQKFAGKGCIAVDSNTDGSASVIVQQAGTSDWSISRMFGFIGDTAGSVFGGTRGMTEMQGPSTGMEGCEGLFETGVDEPKPTPKVLYQADPLTYEDYEMVE